MAASRHELLHTANSRRRGVFLLAPAGSAECVEAAVGAGADGVYVGLKGWSRGGARGEVTWDELAAAKRAAAGRELHVAVNTIPKPRERARLFESIPPLLALGVRDVIVNDIGLLRTLGREFPELRLTASVGCGALNAEDVAFFRDLGAHAVVLPGIVDPQEIAPVTGIRIEVMLHMVEEVNLLGRCAMPSYVLETGSMKRKGVGACFRICQQPWQILDGGVHIGTRLLPSRQISRVADVTAYANAGVDILKLQGRSLPANALAQLVSRYRKAIDGVEDRHSCLSPTLPPKWTVIGR